ncbi:MAG: LamG domain-containing protein [Planctomycetota bacterium]|jgi:hypothetical protein
MFRKLTCLASLVLALGPFLTGVTDAAHPNLVGWWRFDESSGTTASDSAGGDNDGTLSGDVRWRTEAGRSGGALLYGSEDFRARVEIPTTGMSASKGTMMAWGKLAEPFPTNRRDSAYFFGHTTQPAYSNRIQLYFESGSTILSLGLGDSHTRRTNIVRLQTETWYHVALTWNSGRYVVYVDGEEMASDLYWGLTALNDIMDIGNDGNPVSQNTEAFAGLLDEVRLYDHALGADEVRTAMSIAAPPKAWAPSPNDGASLPQTWATLSWMPGESADSHDVYFGEDFDDVYAGTGGTFRGNQVANEFLVGLPGHPCSQGLVVGVTYYWRVDEIDGAVTHKGDIWRFTAAAAPAPEPPSTVSTFHCIGVYWSPNEGGADNICQVHYRSHGSTEWKEAMPLWYDDRGVGGYPEGYRGSIVNLDPGTAYEIKLELLNTGTEEHLTAETWSEDFPIAETVYLPSWTTYHTLRITESGSPDGYILYTHREGASSTIDVRNQEDSCIEVSASYVIIRGLTLRDPSVHGIRILNNVHDVVIEECDISGWGRLQEGEWGHNNDAAVFSDSPNIERIIVQRNKLHHPRPDTNSWKEPARTIPIETHHPMGPQAITFKPRNEKAGNYVIRYNEIYSDQDHYFNDCMGETNNFSYHGFPIRDTDIYGNYVANCWDDGIEAEGANCNVRIWGNYITDTAIKIATQSVSVGPLYIWRNVFGVSRVGPDHNHGWRAFKSGDVQGWGGGKTYIFHNTILQPPPPDHGSRGGIRTAGALLTYTYTRNNIFHVPSGYESINSGSPSYTNDFDYDLYNGHVIAKPGTERNGIYGIPVYIPSSGYDRTTNKGIFELSSSSPGYDAGEVIPNFNDNYTGAAPDMGAHEAGSPPMEFGVNAYQ